MLGVTLWWTSIPSRGSLHATETRIKRQPDGPFGPNADLTRMVQDDDLLRFVLQTWTSLTFVGKAKTSFLLAIHVPNILLVTRSYLFWKFLWIVWDKIKIKAFWFLTKLTQYGQHTSLHTLYSSKHYKKNQVGNSVKQWCTMYIVHVKG